MTQYVAQELVTAFVESAACHFSALEQEFALKRSIETRAYDIEGYHVVDPAAVGNRFFAVTFSLKGERCEVLMTYGDREHNMNCLVRTTSRDPAYALWEWLRAMEVPDGLPDAGEWVLTPLRIESILATYEEVLGGNLARIIDAGDALVPSLQDYRQQRLDKERLQMIDSEHRRLAAKAAEAFHNKDYATVVEALGAVRGALTSSEQMKLRYSSERVDAQSPRI